MDSSLGGAKRSRAALLPSVLPAVPSGVLLDIPARMEPHLKCPSGNPDGELTLRTTSLGKGVPDGGASCV